MPITCFFSSKQFQRRIAERVADQRLIVEIKEVGYALGQPFILHFWVPMSELGRNYDLIRSI